MLDNWLFGGADDEVSDRFDPPYVNELRSRCAAALAAARADRAIATDRLAYIRRWRDESQQEMAAAREAMGNVAVREARAADPLALPVQRRRESGDLDGRPRWRRPRRPTTPTAMRATPSRSGRARAGCSAPSGGPSSSPG